MLPKLRSEILYRRSAQTMKWKGISFVSTVLTRYKLSKSALLNYLAFDAGVTVLDYAVKRGDVEIVEILLKHGANPYSLSKLGMNAFGVCEKHGPFESVELCLQKYSP